MAPPPPEHDPFTPPRPSRVGPVVGTGAVLILLTIIAGMVLPALANDAYWGHHRSSCGNNQRQIALSALVYANDNDQLWPCRPTDAHGAPARGIADIDGFCTAAASLEMLWIRSNGDLPVKYFVCMNHRATRDYLSAPTSGLTYAGGISQWGAHHRPQEAGGPGGMAYAYDWSAPTNASAIRIILADRGTITVAHKRVSMSAAADGHVVTINLLDQARPAGCLATTDEFGGWEGIRGPAKDSSTGTSLDDVYDEQGDDGAILVPANGSSTRAWVR
jgi:hypothetical protein